MNFHYNIANTCCFFGHREITKTEELKTKLYKTIENLILKENINTFCVFYYDNTYAPPKRKSGTKIAFDHAFKKQKAIINLFHSR